MQLFLFHPKQTKLINLLVVTYFTLYLQSSTSPLQSHHNFSSDPITYKNPKLRLPPPVHHLEKMNNCLYIGFILLIKRALSAYALLNHTGFPFKGIT